MVELLRVDGGQRLRGPDLAEVTRSGRRRLGGIIPAGKRKNQDGLAEPGRLLEQGQRVAGRHEKRPSGSMPEGVHPCKLKEAPPGPKNKRLTRRARVPYHGRR